MHFSFCKMRDFTFLLLLVSLIFQGFELCASLNDEGRALLRFRESIDVDSQGVLSNWKEENEEEQEEKESDYYCSWFGVICSDDSRVVALNLQNLGLQGMISPQIGNLIHLRILDLSNNSLYGVIPREIGELKQLVILDLRNNSLSGTLPSSLSNILSLKLLLIKGNPLSNNLPLELLNLSSISEIIENSSFKINENIDYKAIKHTRRTLQDSDSPPDPPKPSTNSPFPSPLSSPVPATPTATQAPPHQILTPPSTPPPQRAESARKKGNGVLFVILVPIVGTIAILTAGLVLYLICFRVRTVNIAPWTTGLSGPISRAFVTGVPSLGRPELDAACEEFSNIITNLEDCKIYKGTLSSGVEIAVVSSLATSAAEWTALDEDQFRLKISNLSKVNHRNFMNLLGYSKVDEPFTRMLVVEYAPNGTLFEHLHIREAEQLDWPVRLRISMGIIYCLEYIEHLNLPNPLRVLNSSTIYLSEDYAAKISDIRLRSDTTKNSKKPNKSPDQDSAQQEPIVYKYAILLLEIISGRLPFSEDTGLLVLWASSYLNGKRELMDMVDPSLNGSVPKEILERICEVIRACINPNFEERPKVNDVAKWMREISGVSPEMAIPRNSPLWWAELEIVSSEGG
ncbi:hypothetical protein LUZ60_015371 [Juncus effusus]|nr:hypothetical protein LUZ60_015371 [Juncus effusus]